MSKLKVSLPPFVHSQDRLGRWRIDLIIAFMPVLIFLSISAPALGVRFIVAGLAFLFSGELVERWLLKGRRTDTGLRLKYISQAVLFAGIMAGSTPWAWLVAAIITAVLMEELVLGSPGRPVFPAFIAAWILLAAGLKSTLHEFYTWPVLVFAGIGGGYLLARKRLSWPVLAGSAFALVGAVIYSGSVDAGRIFKLGVVVLLMLGYPGLVPMGRIKRFLFGFICAVMIMKYGAWGFAVCLGITPVLDRI